MNLFGIGGAELLLIVVIMMVVAGPKRMLQWAYILGRYLGQLRIVWRQSMESIQREFEESGVDIQLPKDIPTRSDITRLARQALKPVEEPMNEVIKEYEDQHRAIKDTISTRPGVHGRLNGNMQEALSSSIDDTSQAGFGTWSGKHEE